ncbi:MAG: phosphatidylcholine/phosphatidylserine synthase [Sphingomonadales bacterium]|jgi:CDP-diacylglycerol--serine O-phosphatidyltransferase
MRDDDLEGEVQAEQKHSALPLRSMVPNIITMLALCAGLTGIKFAIAGRWEAAVFAVVLAGIFDGTDGSVARLLKGVTKFGAELDSLSDVVAFGIAPALILFMWTLNELGGIGWVVALAYAGCCALRLARFNTALEEEKPAPLAAGYSLGVPAPAAAGLALFPMMISFWTIKDDIVTPTLTAIYVAGISVLMVSRLPTFTFKMVKLRPSMRFPLMALVPLLVACLTIWPWKTLCVVTLLYLVSLPLSYRSAKKMVANLDIW